MRIIEILDQFAIVFSQGQFVAGVHEADDRNQAVALVRRLQKKISEATHDR